MDTAAMDATVMDAALSQGLDIRLLEILRVNHWGRDSEKSHREWKY